jgi:hypothetical protein
VTTHITGGSLSPNPSMESSGNSPVNASQESTRKPSIGPGARVTGKAGSARSSLYSAMPTHASKPPSLGPIAGKPDE